MKKFLGFLLGSLMILGITGNASAAPMTWTDIIDWDPNVRLTDGDGFIGERRDGFRYAHDLTDDGFIPGVDKVGSYTLRVRLYSDGNPQTVEGAEIIQLGSPRNPNTVTEYHFSWAFNEIGWTLAGLIDINNDGDLNVYIEPTAGDFKLDWSVLTAVEAPVPEPTTMALFGIGLLSIAGFARRKNRA